MAQEAGVEVAVAVGPQPGKGTKAPADLEANTAPTEPDNHAANQAANSSAKNVWSSNCMWALFIVGFIFPPLWWLGVAVGCKGGKDSECLIKRRKGMTKQQTLAWAACIVMTVVSGLVLVLVLSIYFGRPGPQQDGPYYMTLAGPSDVFPDLTDPRTLAKLATAVYGGLSLGTNMYPQTGLAVWVDSLATVPPPPARRRLLQDTPAENDTLEVAVLAYTLQILAGLPPSTELADRIEDGSAADGVSEQLVKAGVLASEHVGKLSLGLIGAVTRTKLAEMLEKKDGNPAFNLVPVGKRCKGAWSEWSECAAGSCGSQNRTFTIPPPTAEPEQHAQNETETESETESESGSSSRLQKAGGRSGSGNQGGHGQQSNQGGNGQQGSQPWTSGGQSSQAGRNKEQQQGLAHAFASGHGQGLALALGHVECPVLNNTVQTRSCSDTCELPSCAGAPSLEFATASAEAAVSVDSWDCTDVGTVNGTTCIGSCPIGNFTGTITATCLNGVYTIADPTCATGES